MNAIFQRGGEQIVPPLHEGGEQQQGILNVRNRIGAGVVRGESVPRLLGR